MSSPDSGSCTTVRLMVCLTIKIATLPSRALLPSFWVRVRVTALSFISETVIQSAAGSTLSGLAETG